MNDIYAFLANLFLILSRYFAQRIQIPTNKECLKPRLETIPRFPIPISNRAQSPQEIRRQMWREFLYG